MTVPEPKAMTKEERIRALRFADLFHNAKNLDVRRQARLTHSYEATLAALESRCSELEADRQDAERWRFIRQFMKVERWTNFASLTVYDFKIQSSNDPQASIEEIIDAAFRANKEKDNG